MLLHLFSWSCALSQATRRSALTSGAAYAASAAANGLLPLPHATPLPALASGGATAGKTTSIPRAKLRYYDRITAAVVAYEAVPAAVDAGSRDGGGFFSAAEDAGASELKTAGYLLAVAFKLDSVRLAPPLSRAHTHAAPAHTPSPLLCAQKKPPDTLVTVKNWKKVMSDLERLQAAVKSGKREDVVRVFAASRLSMDAYLESVELPPLGDARYS